MDVDESCDFRVGGPALVRSGTIDLRNMEVRPTGGRFWEGTYGNRVKWFLNYYLGF